MRTVLISLMLALLFSTHLPGCGEAPFNFEPDGGKGDLSRPAEADAAPKPALGCQAYLDCVATCSRGATASFSACAAQCDASAKPTAINAYRRARSCGERWCLGKTDGGMAKCAVVGATLAETSGAPIVAGGPCDTCLANSLAGLYGGSCVPSGSPDCNPSACDTAVAACHEDL
jgi:hypothetical protein